MASPSEERTGYRDLLPSLTHRTLGNRLYYTDVDNLAYTQKGNTVDDIELKAVIDWKGADVKSLRVEKSSMLCRMKLAKQLRLPMFVVVTYLTEEYPVKMMFVKPYNEKAEELVRRSGEWMSLYEYSEFEHKFRGLNFNPFEFCDNLHGWLKDLSKDKAEYPLPVFE